jgi:hypothetical protein
MCDLVAVPCEATGCDEKYCFRCFRCFKYACLKHLQFCMNMKAEWVCYCNECLKIVEHTSTDLDQVILTNDTRK